MARKYLPESGANRDENGMRDMVIEQTITKGTPPIKLTYRTFGRDADSPLLMLRYAANVLLPMAEKVVADGGDFEDHDAGQFYDDWEYGVDLRHRQGNKVGGPAEPWVPVPGKRDGSRVNLVTGVKQDKQENPLADSWTIEQRIAYVNAMTMAAAVDNALPPKQVEAGRKGLLEAGLVEQKNGALVVAKTKK